ncbi:myb/SANT-like DNA-binding domain-containing protein 3, partial [Aphis craccivora]
RDIYKTGGGQSQIHSSTINNKIIGMMGNRFESVESPYDCDGDFPIYTDDQCIEIFDECSPVEYSYLGPNDMEVNALEPISLKFDDVVDDQHEAYENITSHKQSTQKAIETSTPREKFPKSSTTRVPPKKVYENLNELANKQLSSYNLKESFINDNNNLKRKQSDIKLEILEIEKIVAIEKLKGERDNYISQAKQNKLKEEILEYELKKKLKEL